MCTHLGWDVPWNAAENKFISHCHGSQYNDQEKIVRNKCFTFSVLYFEISSSNKNKKSFSWLILLSHSSIIKKIIFNQVWIFSLESGLFCYIFIYFFLFLFFHHSLTPTRFDLVESNPFYHWAKSTKKIRSIFRPKVLCEILDFSSFSIPIS